MEIISVPQQLKDIAQLRYIIIINSDQFALLFPRVPILSSLPNINNRSL